MVVPAQATCVCERLPLVIQNRIIANVKSDLTLMLYKNSLLNKLNTAKVDGLCFSHEWCRDD